MAEIIRLESVPSTNTWLKTLAQQGAPCGTAVVAREQTAGRGRTGNSFVSEPGGLYYSYLMDTSFLPLADVTMITSLVAVEAVRALYSAYRICADIKWVNDILYHGKKLGGILVEAGRLTAEGRIPYVVVGIGVNINQRSMPPELKEKVTSLTIEHGCEWDAEGLLCALSERFDALAEDLHTPEVLAENFAEYKALCSTVGSEISFERNGVQETCTAVGIDDTCGLMVRYADGRTETLRSGEIHIRMTAKNIS